MLLVSSLRCPRCKGSLKKQKDQSFVCKKCDAVYPTLDGVPSLIPDAEPLDLESHTCDVSVLVMTRNEGPNVGKQLQDSAKILESLGVEYEVIVIDGNSTDNTVEQVLALGARVERQTEPGYGSAFRQGLALCRGERILTLDADGSHDPNFIRTLWAQKDSSELVIASRYKGGDAKMPRSRLILSKMLNKCMSMFLAIPIKDLSSGFRLYQRHAAQSVKLEGRDFNILIELLVKMYIAGFLVKEVPFFYKPRGAGRSNVMLARFAASYMRSSLTLWRLRRSVAAADYDSRAFRSLIYPQRYWQQSRFRIIIDMLEGQTSDILDVGCGSSKIIQFLPGAVGLDYMLEKLRYLRQIHSQLVHGSVFGLPFADNSFQVVVCSQVIEHIPDTEAAVGELLRVLKPGGKLILGTPDYAGWQWPTIEWIYERVITGGYAEEHITHLTRDGMLEMLDKLGADYLDEDFILKAEWVGLFRKR